MASTVRLSPEDGASRPPRAALTAPRGPRPADGRVVEACRSLRVSPPFRLDLTAWALRRRPHNRIDVWDTSYRRVLVVGGRAMAAEVAQSGPPHHPDLRATISARAEDLTEERIAATCRILETTLGTEVDLEAFYRLARRDRDLSGVVARFRGLRPPRFPTVFEGLVNAVACQQLSLEVGIELLNRLTDAYGAPGPGPAPTMSAFPEPSALASSSHADLLALGFSAQKARTLVGLGRAAASGELAAMGLDRSDSAPASVALQRLSGIGRWSAEYVLLRGLGRLEVYPGDDVGARNKLQAFLELSGPPDYDAIRAITSRWGRYAGMMYFHLLLDGLAHRGVIADVDRS